MRLWRSEGRLVKAKMDFVSALPLERGNIDH
jgi:hypothetical protein